MQTPTLEETSALAAIARWRSAHGDADDFPFEPVVAAFHRSGRHHVAPDVLAALADVRRAMAAAPDANPGTLLLDRFLDVALAKWEERFANPTYLGLSLLPLPTEDVHGRDVSAATWSYDRLLVQLIADLMRFEIDVADGATDLLPQLRPEARTSAKRCRLGLQVTGPAARRLGWGDLMVAPDPLASARRVWIRVVADLAPTERRALQLTMLPVSLVHDEYQFIRILQAFEATFALMAVHLSAAIQQLNEGDPGLAAELIAAAARTLQEAAPLFSLVGTMRVEAFQTFRVFTEGASAIQSRNYKLVEALCRRPDQARLDSAAYLAVPEVRQRVLTGHRSLDDAYLAAHASGHFGDHDVAGLERVMGEFAVTLRRWRRTHYRLAERMLGQRTGTGYTEGAPYLRAVQSIPVFASLATPDEADEPRDAQSEAGTGRVSPDDPPTRGRCPFSGAVFPASGMSQAGVG